MTKWLAFDLHCYQDSNNDGGDADAPKTAAAGGWKTQLHYVWDIMLDRLLDTSNAVKSNFPEFFRIVVDGMSKVYEQCLVSFFISESLFSSTASPERKYWGFQVFQKALHLVSEDNMPMLFTKNFMRTWINHLSKQDRYLHKAAKQTVDISSLQGFWWSLTTHTYAQVAEIQTFVQRNPKLGFALILQLTGVHGSQQFDKITKTKTVESIISTMDADDIKQYIAYLLNQANDSEWVSLDSSYHLSAVINLWPLVVLVGSRWKSSTLVDDGSSTNCLVWFETAL